MAYAGTINLSRFAPNRVFQRDCRSGDPAGNWTVRFGQGWSLISLALSPTTAFQLLEYRVRDAANPTGAALLGWTSCSGPQSAVEVVASIYLPAATAWFLVDVRADGDDGSTETTNAVGVGEVIAASGQSLATDIWSTAASGDPATLASCGVAAGPYGVCYAAWDGAPPPSSAAAWTVPADSTSYASTFCAEFLRLAVLGSGVNCALVGYSWSGEPISSWRTDGSGPKNVWSPLAATLDNAVGVGGRIGTLIWIHGHNDARLPQAGVDGDELTADKYLAALATLVGTLAARYNGCAFRRILSSIPALGSNWVTTTPKFDPTYVQQIRSAHLQFVAGDSLTVGHVDGLDVTLWSDQTHPSQTGNISFARHFYRAFMQGIGDLAHASGDAGPRLVGTGSRSSGSNLVYLNVAQSNGSALLCSGGGTGAASQFQVYRIGSTAVGSQFPVQRADLLNPNTIVLTLSSTPDDGVALDVWYRLPPDSSAALAASNQIYDDNVSGSMGDGLSFGRQLVMRPTPVTVPAPSLRRPLLLAPGMLLQVGTGSSALTT